MASLFQPKFVDLVRNFSTTVGTGAFVLGPAVNGFTGFAAACQAGDQFYYSAIGVDKPAEREVGRGTLLADGTIDRTPINGVKTNFTSGTKSIALIAAAEWFASVQSAANASAAAGSNSVISRSALAVFPQAQASAFLSEPGREGMFVWNGSNLSANVAADTAQAIYIAPTSDLTGATGAWVRNYSGAKDLRWYGAKVDGVSDDSVALQAWLDAGGPLTFPAGQAYSSATLIVRKCVYLQGASYGFDARLVGYESMPGSRIRFAAGVAGFDVQPQWVPRDWSDKTPTQEGALNSVFEGFALIGGGGATATGFYSRTGFRAHNVTVEGFSGKGFDISASVNGPNIGEASDYAESGNANNSTLIDCQAYNNGGHGLHIRGYDANTILIQGFNGSTNGGWGIRDESLIGNTYVKPHTSSNAGGAIWADRTHTCGFIDPYIEGAFNDATTISGSCLVIGNDISGLQTSTESPAIITGPLISGAIHKITGSTLPGALASAIGQLFNFDGLWLQGSGSTADIVLANKNGFPAAVVPAGTVNFTVHGNYSQDGADPTITAFGTAADGIGAQLLLGRGGTERFQIYESGAGSYISADTLILRDNATRTITYATLSAAGAAFNGPISASNLSGTNTGDQTITLTGDVTGSGTGSFATAIGANKVTFGKFVAATAAGVVGASAAGNFAQLGLAGGLGVSGGNLTINGAINSATSVAIAGAITSSGAGIGYATGAGGTVAQATSKSTGVTLNKACGQITMNAAALAASTTVSFPLTNSQIGAGDILVLNHISGGTASAYHLNAQCGAGTASINVRNITSGSLSEAIVIGFALVKAVTA